MSKNTKKKILVTGGAGYIGSHTCKHLSQEGYEPVTYDNLSRGNQWAVKWGPFIEGDIRDTEKLTEVIGDLKPEAVIHFAAFAYVGESVEKPSDYYNNNVGGTLSLLDSMKSAGCRKIVFSSSCATYGIPNSDYISENETQEPINPYGNTKLACEHIIRDYCTTYGMSAIALRYFNAAGADPNLEIGEHHIPETHIIPNCIKVALGKASELEVFGNDYPTKDGTCVRDYIHVMDLATGHLLALQSLSSDKEFWAYNLSNLRGFSIIEVINEVEKTTGKKVKFRFSNRRPGDPPTLVGDSTKAREELKWEPRHSDLSTIVKTAYQWEMKIDALEL